MMEKYLNSFKEMISLRNLTDHTLKNYCTYIKAYLSYLSTVIYKKPEEATWDDLRDFIRWIQRTRGLSDRTINACISQLRFFTIYVLHKPWDPSQVPLRKFDTYLPFVPTKQEVFTLIDSFEDIKPKAMTALMYSSGLRIGEVCRLQYEDVSRKQMTIHIPKSKSRSDRYAILSENALEILTRYWYESGKPTGYLFPKQRNAEKPIDTFYLSRRIHLQEQALGWEQRITCHSLRHAFGTHLYEAGADLLTIKELLGHKSLASTMIYIHLAVGKNVKILSPFDRRED